MGTSNTISFAPIANGGQAVSSPPSSRLARWQRQNNSKSARCRITQPAAFAVYHNHFFLTADKAVAQYDAKNDFARSLDDCYAAVRERVKQGGPGWPA
jgi:hypothetical protein